VSAPLPQLAPVPVALPPAARKVSGTLTERSVRKAVLDTLASDAAAEYTAASGGWMVAVAQREGAWFACSMAAGSGMTAGWRELMAGYRAALAAEQDAAGRLRAAVDGILPGC
jgi:hypothetical protein